MKRESLASRIKRIREEENDRAERGIIIGYLIILLVYVALLG